MLAPTLAAPFMGVLADRLPRRQVMIAADLVRFVLVGLAAVIVWADGPLLVVYAITSLVSVATTAFRPAQAALLPSLARTPDRLTASAISSTIESVMSFGGPALGGVIVASADAGTAFAVTAAMFLWSALLLLGVHEPKRQAREDDEAQEASGIVAELGVGARTLVADRRVGLLVGLIGAQVLVAGAFLVLVTGVAFETLEGGEKQLGLLLSALGVGGVLGAGVSLGLIGSRLTRSFAVGVVLWGVPIALLAIWQSSFGAFVLVALVGFANTLVDVAAFTLLQRAVPDDVLARVFGILESIMYGATVAGALAAPALIGVVGLDASLVVTGLFLLVVVALTWPLLRGLDIAPKPSEETLALLGSVPFLASASADRARASGRGTPLVEGRWRPGRLRGRGSRRSLLSRRRWPGLGGRRRPADPRGRARVLLRRDRAAAGRAPHGDRDRDDRLGAARARARRVPRRGHGLLRELHGGGCRGCVAVACLPTGVARAVENVACDG